MCVTNFLASLFCCSHILENWKQCHCHFYAAAQFVSAQMCTSWICTIMWTYQYISNLFHNFYDNQNCCFLLRQDTEPRTHHHGDHVVTLIAELSLFLQVPYTFKSQGNATAAFFSCNTLTLWVQETFAGGLLINGFALTLQHWDKQQQFYWVFLVYIWKKVLLCESACRMNFRCLSILIEVDKRNRD